MHFQISRNGQTYGPYTLDDLQRYLASGNVLPTDLAKSDDMPDWIPVSQLLATPPGPAAGTSAEQPGGAQPVHTQPVYAGPSPANVAVHPALGNSPYPDAPDLHYGLTILFSVLTCGLFTIIWDIVIAAWLRRVQPTDQSLFWYLGSLAVRAVKWVASLFLVGTAFRHNANPTDFVSSQFVGMAAISKVMTLAIAGTLIAANFIKRASLEEHFNGPEPVGLQLSGVMTFFFAPWYFQYHLNRINALKQAARFGAPQAF